MKKLYQIIGLSLVINGLMAQNPSQMNIIDIQNQYILQAQLFQNVVADISDEEADQRISENTNSFKWIVGHSLDIQYNLAMMLGIRAENPYADSFGFGKPFDPEAKYPSLASMLADWNALSPQIIKAMEDLSTEALQSELPFPIPFPEQNLKGFLAFQMHHLGYEIGQLGLYRRFLAKEAMSYQLN